jgi:outer membrane protein assembly factor BamD
MRFVNRSVLLLAAAALAGCHHKVAPKTTPNPLTASPQMIDSLWREGMNYYNRHKWDKAAAAFDRVELELLPGDPRALMARMYLGELYVREGSNLQGVREYRRIVDEFSTDSLAPEALLRAADAYNGLWRGPELDDQYGLTAQSVYTELLTRYPTSPAAAKAKEKIQDLDNRFAVKEFRGGVFYLKYKAYEAAIIYFSGLVVDHPKAPIVPMALADLIIAYRKLGYAEDIRDKCTYMKDHWPDTPQYKQSCLLVPPGPAGKPAGTPAGKPATTPAGKPAGT